MATFLAEYQANPGQQLRSGGGQGSTSIFPGKQGPIFVKVYRADRFAADIHRKGCCHRHLTAKHLFVDEAGSFSLIDLEAATLTEPPIPAPLRSTSGR